ncbi:MAG: 4Fe-4S dicluster domain-containing protein, partial [Bacteroidota bacterium]
LKAIEDFKLTYPETEVVMYDPVSSAALLDANQENFGMRVVPSYHFAEADVIVSFGADFLGSWISPTEYSHGYTENRIIHDLDHPKMSRHIHVESHMSLTGSNADNRIIIKPSEQGAAIATLYNEVASLNGATLVAAPQLDDKTKKAMKRLASELQKNKQKSLIVSGSNNKGEQILVNAINNLLGSYGHTIGFDRPSYQRQGSDQAVQALINKMNKGAYDAIFVMDVNPAFDLPNADDFRAAFEKVPVKVSFAPTPNDTAAICDYVTPASHYLESWGDAMPKKGVYALIQPTISPLFDTRQVEECLLRWSASPSFNADSTAPMFDYLKSNWEATVFPQQTKFGTFQVFWDSSLHDGVFETDVPSVAVTFTGDVNSAAAIINKPSSAEYELAIFETLNVGAGQYASNPWLQELPDPVMRTVWGNYLAIPIGWDGGNSFTSFKNLNQSELYGEADLIDVTVNGAPRRVTVARQFGLKNNTFAIALGYGREVISQTGKDTGVNVTPWLSFDNNGYIKYYADIEAISDKVDTDKLFACVQYHHTMGVTGTDPETNEEINVDEKTVMTLGSGFQGGLTKRSIIYQANLSEIEELKEHIHERREEAKKLNDTTLYPFEEYSEKYYSQGHHWGLYVDLNACTGCGACQIACMAENNIPIVGKTEVARHHEMTWLRIDRYYYGDYENPNVVYQPMMCQHCDNAPCENVCPVAATNHSSEGLNQMTYNRCIGTRYCANNCPYKVRRFNWLDYTTADLFASNESYINGEDVPFGADNLTRMVLNPDVTVRSRGVIEKCSFCVQRIQEGKLTAKREKRRLRDGDVKGACVSACPTGGIVFGDMNDPESQISQRLDRDLNYRVLEETNTQASVFYSAKVINRDEELS